MKIVYRIILAVLVSIGLSSMGINGSVDILQTLFTVLGIIFSIAMCLLVSFNLSRILNQNIYKRLRKSLAHTRGYILADFTICAGVFVIASLDGLKDMSIHLFWKLSLSIPLTGICIIVSSILYEAYNFNKIRRLQENIEEQIIKEDTASLK
ncbi:MAG: hypothetical protein LUD17_05005 [Bacteroidales bacterium]|nr:hypothetical protein [Bacteroidales bacterium]